MAHSGSRDRNLQRGWRFIQNGGYGEKSEKIWVRDVAKAKTNKMAEKAEVQFKKKRVKKDKFCMQEFLEYGKVLEVSFFAVQCFFFVILKLGVMDLSVLDCGTPYR